MVFTSSISTNMVIKNGETDGNLCMQPSKEAAIINYLKYFIGLPATLPFITFIIWILRFQITIFRNVRKPFLGFINTPPKLPCGKVSNWPLINYGMKTPKGWSPSGNITEWKNGSHRSIILFTRSLNLKTHIFFFRISFLNFIIHCNWLIQCLADWLTLRPVAENTSLESLFLNDPTAQKLYKHIKEEGRKNFGFRAFQVQGTAFCFFKPTTV